MAKVLILPDYAGQDLPSEGLERYDHIYLVTEQQENLPVNVVMHLMKLIQDARVNIEFLQMSYNSETELLLSMAFKIAQMAMSDADIQVTFVTSNLAFDNLVSAGKNNGFHVSRADGFTRISAIPSGPSEVQRPVQPSIVQSSKPEPQPKPVVPETPKAQPAKAASDSKKNNNQRLISSLLNGNK